MTDGTREIAAAILDRLLNPKRTIEGLIRPLSRNA